MCRYRVWLGGKTGIWKGVRKCGCPLTRVSVSGELTVLRTCKIPKKLVNQHDTGMGQSIKLWTVNWRDAYPFRSGSTFLVLRTQISLVWPRSRHSWLIIFMSQKGKICFWVPTASPTACTRHRPPAGASKDFRRLAQGIIGRVKTRKSWAFPSRLCAPTAENL